MDKAGMPMTRADLLELAGRLSTPGEGCMTLQRAEAFSDYLNAPRLTSEFESEANVMGLLIAVGELFAIRPDPERGAAQVSEAVIRIGEAVAAFKPGLKSAEHWLTLAVRAGDPGEHVEVTMERARSLERFAAKGASAAWIDGSLVKAFVETVAHFGLEMAFGPSANRLEVVREMRAKFGELARSMSTDKRAA